MGVSSPLLKERERNGADLRERERERKKNKELIRYTSDPGKKKVGEVKKITTHKNAELEIKEALPTSQSCHGPCKKGEGGGG